MAKAPPRKIPITFEETGHSGTQIYAGTILGEEYNRHLIGRRGAKIYDEMRRSDSTCRQALWALKYPIIQADWFTEADGEDSDEAAAKEFLDENLFHILNWRHVIEEALTCLDFGYSVMEMVFEPREVNGTLRIVLSKLAWRKPTSIYKWETTDSQPGITQYTIQGETSTELRKLVRFTIQQEGDNYEGVSILRSAYKHWYYKEKFYKMEAIGYERQSVGVPYASYPVGASKDDKRDVKKLLQNMRANQQAYMMHPIGWEAGFMDMGAGSTKDTKPGTDHHDLKILGAVFADFLMLGQTKTGSKGLSEDKSRFFELGVAAVADLITEVFNEIVVKTLIDLNFTTDTYPRVRHGGVGDENLPIVSDAVSKFVLAGGLNIRPEDENVIRKMLHWPELTDEEIKERQKDAELAKKQLQSQTVDKPADKSTGKDGKPVDGADTEGDLKASVLLAEARALSTKLDKVLYGTQSQAA